MLPSFEFVDEFFWSSFQKFSNNQSGNPNILHIWQMMLETIHGKSSPVTKGVNYHIISSKSFFDPCQCIITHVSLYILHHAYIVAIKVPATSAITMVTCKQQIQQCQRNCEAASSSEPSSVLGFVLQTSLHPYRRLPH